jgi:hypothetical protein
MKEQMKTMVEEDQKGYHDPQVISEFSQDIFKSMLVQEEEHKVTPHDYLKTVQTEIKDT